MTTGVAISDLSALVTPLSANDFSDLLTARRLHHQPGFDPHRFDPLLDWHGLIGAIHDGGLPADRLRLMRRERQVKDVVYKGNGVVNAKTLDDMLAAGASLIVNRADLSISPIAALCAAVAAACGDHVTCGAIASTGPGGALDRHYDEMDLLILQVDGAKRWTVYDNPVPDPVLGMKVAPFDPASGVALDIVLNAGDWLFLPAGHSHHCETQGLRSLHLAMGFFPLTAPRVLDLMMRDMLASPEHRRPIRVSAAETEAAEAALKRQLIERIEAMSLPDLARRHRETSVGKR